MSSLDFPAILVLVTVFSGVVTLADFVYTRWQKSKGVTVAKTKPALIDYARSFFPVLLFVLIIRSFVAQPYTVPTGSLEPTVMPGDFIFVTQYNYGLRLPVWRNQIVKTGKPKIGQIALFQWPVNHHVTFVKRVLGTPGDRISYVNKVFTINGKKATQKFLGYSTDSDSPGGPSWRVKVMEENLNGVKHKIYVCPDDSANCPNPAVHNFYNLVVPKGEYFMIGDNRDNSDDSRDWGFVPFKDFIGRARYVWLSWNKGAKSIFKKIRWDRFGEKL